jgi:hypothetical protein
MLPHPALSQARMTRVKHEAVTSLWPSFEETAKGCEAVIACFESAISAALLAASSSTVGIYGGTKRRFARVLSSPSVPQPLGFLAEGRASGSTPKASFARSSSRHHRLSPHNSNQARHSDTTARGFQKRYGHILVKPARLFSGLGVAKGAAGAANAAGFWCGYSITSSARASRLCGTVRPSDFAVFRLMASARRVGCSMGRSAGAAP